MSDIMHVEPADIERESFNIIAKELKEMGSDLDPVYAPVTMRVIHATADFEYAKTMYYSKDIPDKVREAFREGTLLVTDTNMALSGINKKVIAKLGMEAVCYMGDEDVALEAKKRGCTRAAVSMEKAAASGRNLIIVSGNAPTALLRIRELIDEGKCRPKLIIGVPVGFVNVVVSKERIMETEIPCIIARGRKGGSNVAAAITNALLYQLDRSRGMGK